MSSDDCDPLSISWLASGLSDTELSSQSSSSSSGLSDFVDANTGFGLNTSIGQDRSTTDESCVTYALPPLMPVKPVEQKILPDLSNRLSSSASDDRSVSKKYGDSVNARNFNQSSSGHSPRTKKREWRLKMSRKLADIPVGDLNPDELPLTALMNVGFFGFQSFLLSTHSQALIHPF